MLSDQAKQLLTAFVDGELSQRQRKAVMRLLHRSSEARALLRQLQENAHQMKQLPRRKVKPSLVADIMAAIAERQVQPKPVEQPRRTRRRWLPYVTAAMAASLVIGVISVLAWKAYNEPEGPKNNGNQLVKVDDKKPEPKPEMIAPPTPTPPREVNPLLKSVIEGSVGGFAQVPAPPFAATFAQLDPKKGAKSADLAREIERTPALHLDITVKSNAMAMARLKEVLMARGITLVTDGSASKSLDNKNQAKVEYLVYAENLTRDELAKVMGELSEGYVVGLNGNQKNVNTPYKNVTLTGIDKNDKNKVAKLLGVDPATMEPKGKEQKVEAKRLAVVLPTAPGSQPSAEMRQFVNQRRVPQTDAVQVLFKIRQE